MYDNEEDKEPEAPPEKRTRQDVEFEVMKTKVNLIANLLPQLLPQVQPQQTEEVDQTESTLKLGECLTTIDEKKASRAASDERLSQLETLQHFETSEWKEVRYSSALKEMVASPGFIELRVNNELCYLEKGKDPLLSTDRVMAGLTHVLLNQKDALKDILTLLIDWVIDNQATLTKEELTNVVTENFGTGSVIFNNFEQALQVICGKRAESIEARRERILAEIPIKNVQVALRKIPPSAEFLFAKEELTSLITSLGGAQAWLNPPPGLTQKKAVQRKDSSRSSSTSLTHQSTSGSGFQSLARQGFQPRNSTTPRQSGNRSNYRAKRDSSGVKKMDSFRKKSDR